MPEPRVTRLEANRRIVRGIAAAVEKHKDLRFHQLLQNIGIEKPNEDQFYDESELTLGQMKA